MRAFPNLVVLGGLAMAGGAGLYMLMGSDRTPSPSDTASGALLAPPSPIDQQAFLAAGLPFEPRSFELSAEMSPQALEARIVQLIQEPGTERTRLGHVMWRLLQEAEPDSDRAWVLLLGLRELKPLNWADGLLGYLQRDDLPPRMTVAVLDAIDQGFADPLLGAYTEDGTVSVNSLRQRVLDYLDARILNMDDAPLEVYRKIVTLYPRYAEGDDAAECIDEFISRYENKLPTSRLDGLELSEMAFTHAFLSADHLNQHLPQLLSRMAAWPASDRGKVDQMLYVHLGGIGIAGATPATLDSLRVYLKQAEPVSPSCPAELRSKIDQTLAAL